MSPSPRILLVDDDVWVLKMVKAVLERHGYVIDSATNGAEALDRVDDACPDLIITDVTMPKMDGWTLVRILRARPETAFTPVIFLTALGSDENRIHGFRLGADDYLQKPVHFLEFELRVQRLIARGLHSKSKLKESLGAPEAGGVQGNLVALGLSSVFVLLEMEKKSGFLRINDASASDGKPTDATGAELAFRDGAIIRAKLDGRAHPSGEECVYEVLRWSKGKFTFHPCPVDGDDEIRSSTMHLLMEGARRIDEGAR